MVQGGVNYLLVVHRLKKVENHCSKRSVIDSYPISRNFYHSAWVKHSAIVYNLNKSLKQVCQMPTGWFQSMFCLLFVSKNYQTVKKSKERNINKNRNSIQNK